MQSQSNWAGNHTYRADRYVEPASVAELAAVIRDAGSVRMLGSRHSFNDIADSDGVLVDTAALPHDVRIDPASHTATVAGGMRYGDVARVLQRQGWALHNLASLPHISLAGAVATGTHGSGDRNGSLAAAVAGVRILTASGDVIGLRRGDPDFAGAVVSMGALGAVIEVTLDIQPTFDVRQRVFGGLPWSAVEEHFDDIFSAAYSVSLFTLWQEDAVSLAWLKERVDESSRVGDDFLGAAAKTEPVHMIAGMDVRNTTEQLGAPGPWSQRLAHFRLEFTPSGGAEIQSEYLVPRERAVEAIAAVRTLAPTLRPLLQISEIRTVAADEQWMSMAYRRDVVGLHFTWVRDDDAVRAALPALEDAIFPLGARPHWGKVYVDAAQAVPGMYERLGDFRVLADRLDPTGKFRNPFLRRLLG